MENMSAKKFFDNTQKWLKNNPEINIRKAILCDMLKGINKDRILDVGCGDGSISIPLLDNDNQLTLLDISHEMLKLAKLNIKEKYSKNVEMINIDLMDYNTNRLFDVIICIGVLSHVNSIEDMILKVSSLLTNGGYCVFQISEWRNLLTKIQYLVRSINNRQFKYYGYNLNKIHRQKVVDIASRVGLKFVNEARYWPQLPGMKKLFTYNIRYKYQLLTLTNKDISKFGSEIIMLFYKE